LACSLEAALCGGFLRTCGGGGLTNSMASLLTADFSSNESNRVLPVEHEESKQDQPPAEQQGSAFSLVNKLPLERLVERLSQMIEWRHESIFTESERASASCSGRRKTARANYRAVPSVTSDHQALPQAETRNRNGAVTLIPRRTPKKRFLLFLGGQDDARHHWYHWNGYHG
jgi:hypothetical protein